MRGPIHFPAYQNDHILNAIELRSGYIILEVPRQPFGTFKGFFPLQLNLLDTPVDLTES